MREYILHLDNPAERWDNASPIGNGYEGAMVYGIPGIERLCLNEESICGSAEHEPEVKGFRESIDYIRGLFLDGKEYEAEKWAEENLQPAIRRLRSYEYSGELYIDFKTGDEYSGYRRDIDLIKGILNIEYESDGLYYVREYFASYPAHLICCRYTASRSFNADIHYDRSSYDRIRYTEKGIMAECTTLSGNHRFASCFIFRTDGSISCSNTGILINEATYIEVYSRTFTEYRYGDYESKALDFLNSDTVYDYKELKRDHISDFSGLMKRSEIAFDQNPALDEMTTRIRLKRLVRDNESEDFRLMSLYWQFGKYLLVSSSRPGSLPANLQGIWADGTDVPWYGQYTTNINLQMNYWQAEEANISECTEPLFDFLNTKVMEGGRREAELNYKSPGIVLHHVCDIYGFAGVVDGLWGLWPMGAAWLAHHMWEHYLYNEDKDFLRYKAYDFIKACADFAMDNLFEGKDGYLHTGPSSSPENRYYDEQGRGVSLAISPAMDVEIIYGLLSFYGECEKILNISPENGEKAIRMRDRMVPLQIGNDGRLLEWYKDYRETEPQHRHISHAFGLYPSKLINKTDTPDLFEAVKKSIDTRLANGGGGTGWSRAWIINLYARLFRAEDAIRNVRALFTNSTLPNLLDRHPPFQIDGNFGGAAGISEMVMQSHEGFINIIPAVPDYLNGQFTGLRARGGVTVSGKWSGGEVEWVELVNDKPAEVKLKVPGHDIMSVRIDTKRRIEF
ncbi:MAG: glycoside hydrolase N-terminal domain-containing protein [Clostridia bacterium]|nr:glycoside hydrolase N-terminal domain-containing protein [Clostridia bacterium]